MTVSKKTSAAPYLPTGQQLRSSPSVIININDAACTYIGVTSSLRYSISISRNLTNDLVEPEHSVRELLVLFFGASFRIIWIWMVFVKKLYNVKAATIDIKMNIALFKIRCDRFPHFHFRVHFFRQRTKRHILCLCYGQPGKQKEDQGRLFHRQL